jgi:hypothetical protein
MPDHTTPLPRRVMAKKTYSAPVLGTWGTLRDLTKKVGKSGKADGGNTKNQTKTR